MGKKITIIGIINGVDVRVEMDPIELVSEFGRRACQDTNNTGRPFVEWEIHDAAGRPVSPEEQVGAVLVDGQRVFLNLKVGAGGCMERLAA